MSSLLESIIKKTRALTKIPSLVQIIGASRDGSLHLQTTWTQSAVESADSVKFERAFFLDTSSRQVLASTPPQTLDSKAAVCYSPSLKQKAVFRKKEGGEGKETWLLELWSQSQLTQMLDLTGYKKHGAVYTAGDFAAFEWCADETHLLYVAEKKRPAATSFFDTHAAEDAARGAESRWYEDWGEQMTGQHQPVIVTLDVASGEMTVLEQGEGLSLGQPHWRAVQGRLSVAAVAWENAPRRLGLIYCTNRESHVLELWLDGSEPRRLSSSGAGLSCRSPRVSPDGATVVWLQAMAGGPHHKAARLMRLGPDDAEPAVVLDVLDVPEEGGDGYAGLYLQQLPGQCWVSDRELALSTPCGTGLLSYAVDVFTGQRRRLFSDSTNISVLHASAALVAGVQSGLLTPPRLVAAAPADTSQLTLLTDSCPVVESASVTPLTFLRADPPPLAEQPYTALLVSPPPSAKPAPLILFPHGGPHSVMVDAWSSHVALFTQLGFATLLINYRGSAGAGEAALYALPGRIGDLDVADCAYAARDVLAQYSEQLDGDRVVAYGGSHGGFLVTHLSGQHPDLVKAVVARNPVCDVAGMLEGTDITDWNCVEAGFAYSAEVSPERLVAMLAASPMSHVSQVSAPTLLMLGSADRRVPQYQAVAYHQALRARGVTTEIRQYDDCHPLAKPAVNGDVMVHSALWLCENGGCQAGDTA